MILMSDFLSVGGIASIVVGWTVGKWFARKITDKKSFSSQAISDSGDLDDEPLNNDDAYVRNDEGYWRPDGGYWSNGK